MGGINTRYINLYKSKFRTKEEKSLEESDTIKFSEYCIKNPTKLKSIFQWYFKIYFEGVPGVNTTMFENCLEKIAKDGQNKYILFDDNRELMMLNDCTGMLGFIFSREYGLSTFTKKEVSKIMENIKAQSDYFAFLTLDWDYFFSELWYDTIYSIYLKCVSNKETFETCFIADILDKIVSQYGLRLSYIDDDGSNLHRSGLGIDFSSIFGDNAVPCILEFCVNY